MPIVNPIFCIRHSCYSRNRDNQTVSEAPQEARDILEFWLGDSVESPEQATARKDIGIGEERLSTMRSNPKFGFFSQRVLAN